jgi:hypothetical protein
VITTVSELCARQNQEEPIRIQDLVFVWKPLIEGKNVVDSESGEINCCYTA